MSFTRVGTVEYTDLRQLRSQLRIVSVQLNEPIDRFDRMVQGPPVLRGVSKKGAFVAAAVLGSPILRLQTYAQEGWEPAWEVTPLAEVVAQFPGFSVGDRSPELPPDMSAEFPHNAPDWALARDPYDAAWVTNGAILAKPCPVVRACLLNARRYDDRVWVAITDVDVPAPTQFGEDLGRVRFTTSKTLQRLLERAPEYPGARPHTGRFLKAYAGLLAESPAHAHEHAPHAVAPAYGYDDQGKLRYVLMPTKDDFVDCYGVL